jgi:hypothetical protein
MVSSINVFQLIIFILIDLIALVIFGESYKLLVPSLRNFFHPPITSSLLVSDVFISSLFSNIIRFLPLR